MAKNLNRRNFIKTAAAGAGISIIPGTVANVFGDNTKKRIAVRPIIMNSHGSRVRGSLGASGNESAWDILESGGMSLDAVEKCANTIEVDPDDASVGYGGMPNEHGVVQLDAQIFDGKTYNYGAVGGIENIKTPSSVARLVMERTDHIMLCAQGALNFAKMHGFKEENLLTEKGRKAWLYWMENHSTDDDYFPPAKKDGEEENEENNPLAFMDEDELHNGRVHGTVNVIAIDKNGDCAGITTTSGMSWKINGRLGDSPIVGAGLYGDNKVGGAGATGRGEEVIKTCGSFLIVEFMRNGMHPQEACEKVCQRIIDNYNGPENVNFNDKFVAMNLAGDLGCSQIRGNKGSKPLIAYMTDGESKTFEGTTIIEV